MPERHRDLECRSRPRRARRARVRVRLRANRRRSLRRGRLDAAPGRTGRASASWPVGLEEHGRHRDHHPREHADREQPPRDDVEHDDRAPRERAASASSTARERSGSRTPHPPSSNPMRDPRLVEPRADDRRGRERAGSHRRSGIPCSSQSALSFASPANTYTTATCPRNEPHRAERHGRRRRPAARVERPARRGREGEEHASRERDEPVVVQVRRHLDELEPHERDEEHRERDAVVPAERDEAGPRADRDDEQVRRPSDGGGATQPNPA